MLSNVNNTGLIGRQLYAVTEDGDKSIAITDEGLVIGKNLNDDPEFVTLNSDGITRDGVTTNWADIGGGADISVIEEEIEDINGKLTAVEDAPDSTTLKVNKKIVPDDGTNNGSIDINNGNVQINSSGNIVLAPTGNVLINKSNIRLGTDAGSTSQGTNCVAIGDSAGKSNQSSGAIAIGKNAGQTSQGMYSIAIGYGAGNSSQSANSIILNANGGTFNATTPGFYVTSIRNVSSPSYLMAYNNTTKEIMYGPNIRYSSKSIQLSSSDNTMAIEPTYDEQSVTYQNIHKMWTYNGRLALTTKGNTPNTLRINGLLDGTPVKKTVGLLSCYPMIPNCIELRVLAETTSTSLRIQKRVDAVSEWTNLTITDITDTTEFMINITVFI